MTADPRHPPQAEGATTRAMRHEIVADVLGASLLRELRLVLDPKARAALHMDKQEAVARYNRLGRATLAVMEAAGMECT
jgi:hypothetical protein